MIITEEQFKQWNDAVDFAQFGNPKPLKLFRETYPDLFKHMSAMLRKRTKIRTCVKAFATCSPYVYWGALTWNEDENNLREDSKRKQALRFLNKYFKLWLCVEEYGEDNGRYHIHFFGVMIDYTTYIDLINNWHSRIEIECLKNYKDRNKKIKYVTKYVVKQVPRVRMSKRAVLLMAQYKKMIHFKRVGFPSLTKAYYLNEICDVDDLPF